MAPNEQVSGEIEAVLLKSLIGVNYKKVEFRITKRGRNTYMLVHVIVPVDFPVESIAELDAIRHKTERELIAWNSQIVIDMLFVCDEEFAI